MDDKRKQWVTAGVIVGAVTVGLTMLARRVPRDQWAETLGKVTEDAMILLRSRYGDHPTVQMIDQTLKRYEESGRGTPVTRALHDALENKSEKPS